MWALPKNDFDNCSVSLDSESDHFSQFIDDYSDLGNLTYTDATSGKTLSISNDDFAKDFLQPDSSDDYPQTNTLDLSSGYTMTITKKIVSQNGTSDTASTGGGNLAITANIQAPSQQSTINPSYNYIPSEYIFTQTYSPESSILSSGNATYTNSDEDPYYTSNEYVITDSTSSDAQPVKTEKLTSVAKTVSFSNIGEGENKTTTQTTTAITATYDPTTNPITDQVSYNYNPSISSLSKDSAVDYTYFNISSTNPQAVPTPDSIAAIGPSTSTSSDKESTPSTDLNDCLEDNLVTPTQGGQTARIEVDLSYSPDSPLNDPTNSPLSASYDSSQTSGANSDELVITPSILNVDNPNALNYTWEVYTADNANADTWTPINASDLAKMDAPTLSGIGLNKLQFKLNFPDKYLKQYLKIRLTVDDPGTGSGTEREGYGDVVIPVNSSSENIRVFSSSVNDNLQLSLTPNERCTSGMDKVLCPVVKNEFVGLEAPDDFTGNLAWSVDGTPIAPQPGTPTNETFYPVLSETGTQFTVSLTGTDGSGQQVTLTKDFKVEDPSASIVSLDSNASPLLLGDYVDLNNKLWPDYSTTQFSAQPGAAIHLQANFNVPMSFLYGNTYTWYIDNTPIVPGSSNDFGAVINSDGSLQFTANKQVGDVYTIDVAATYTQANDVKKLLNQSYSVALTDFEDKPIGSEITIQMTNAAAPAGTTAMGSGRIMASLISAFPAYFTFLFKIVLTTFLFLAAIWIIFALIPQTNED